MLEAVVTIQVNMIRHQNKALEPRYLRELVRVTVCADGFLYNMVRTIVGQLLLIERNQLDVNLMKEILESKDRAKAANVADAKGLCLEYVGYDDVNDYIEKFIKEGK